MSNQVPVRERVRTFDCERCQRLLQSLLDDGVHLNLSYENVFTPLKHYHIALCAGESGYVIKNDMCFFEKNCARTFKTAVDHFSVWNVTVQRPDRQLCTAL